MRVIFGTGVMSKDGKTPWAAGTLHYLDRHGWLRGAKLSYRNIAVALAKPDVVEVRIIDDDNEEFTIIKEEVKQRVLHFYPRAKSVRVDTSAGRYWAIVNDGAQLGHATTAARAWHDALDNIQLVERERRA